MKNLGREVERTREFIPDDTNFRSETEIIDRIEELKKKKETFDEKTQFVGLKRLGNSYSIVEPFAFFDGPTYDEDKIYRYLSGFSFAIVSTLALGLGHHFSGQSGKIGSIRGAIISPLLFFAGTKFYDYLQEKKFQKQNMYFHYALMHENGFPKIERKKYGEIIQDWTAHRSLNQVSKKDFPRIFGLFK